MEVIWLILLAISLMLLCQKQIFMCASEEATCWVVLFQILLMKFALKLKKANKKLLLDKVNFFPHVKLLKSLSQE